MEEPEIRLVMVIEVLGSPKEHVEDAMRLIIEKLEKDKSIKLVQQTTYKAEPQEIKQDEKEIIQKNKPKANIAEDKLWSTFADIELVTALKNIPNLCFNYMPSSIEIIEPEEIRINAVHLTNFFNDVQALLHKLDRMVKDLSADNIILKRQIKPKSSYEMTYKK